VNPAHRSNLFDKASERREIRSQGAIPYRSIFLNVALQDGVESSDVRRL
jgi:hypothetical protein